MGIINNLKNKAKKGVAKNAAKAVKQAGIKAAAAMLPHLLIPTIITSSIAVIGYGLVDLAVEIFTAKNNPELMYESLEIDDVSELVEIKGDESNGYYLDFIDDIDEKLEKIIVKYNKSGEYHSVPNDVNFLKKLLKAEIITQFPDLKGDIPNDSKDGFQGAVSIRRVTPNKSVRRIKKYRNRRNICCRTK